MRALLCSLLTAVSMVGCAATDDAAAACDRYASPGGSDRAQGTASAPLRTPQRLADRLRPGQTGCLTRGVYAAESSSGLVLRLTRDGVTLRSAPGQRARLRGSVAIEPSAGGTRLTRLSIIGLGAQNTVKVYAPDVRIDGNDITNGGRGQSCLLLGNPAAGAARNVTVSRNYLHDCGSRANGNKDHGIYVSYARGGRITDNLIVRPSAYAVQLYPDARGVVVQRNVIDGSGAVRGGIVVGGDSRSGSAGNRVVGNVIGNAIAAVASSWGGPVGSGNVVTGNCSFATAAGYSDFGVRASGNVEASGGFRDAADGDFRISSGSPCRRAGTDAVVSQLRALGLRPGA